MTTPRPVHPLPHRRRKVSIEIYFVLYLSAIILLLGTTPSHHTGREEELEDVVCNLLASDFKLTVQKDAMLLPFIPASAGVDTTGALLRRDSVNIITALGTFSSVDFAVIAIEDSASGETVTADRASLTPNGDRSVLFQWHPGDADRGGVFRVTIAGAAVPLPPNDLRPELREKVAEILRNRRVVRDSVSFTVHIFPLTDGASIAQAKERQLQLAAAGTGGRTASASAPATNPIAGPSLGGAFALTPAQIRLSVPRGLSWTTQVSLNGAATMNDLDVSITNGNATIVQRTPTYVVLGGEAPAGGDQPVTVTAVRRSDNRQTAAATFTVHPVPLEEALVPKVMMIGQEYQLSFTIQGIPNERVAVEVIENERTMRIARTEGRTTLRYTPDANVHRVRFVRYVDGRVVDDQDVQDIRPLPLPAIDNMPKQPREAAEVQVTTYAYGVLNGRPNECVLKVLAGNAEDAREVDRSFDERSRRMKQVWTVGRRDRQKEFRFKVYAIDMRGSGGGKSQEASFVATE